MAIKKKDVFGKLTGKVLAQVESGKMKTRKYSASELDKEDPKAREDRLQKLDKISAGKFVKARSIAGRYGLHKERQRRYL